jgi:hypothetical protein
MKVEYSPPLFKNQKDELSVKHFKIEDEELTDT